MAYNLRYFIPYVKHSGVETDIWILEKDTSVGTFQTLVADGNPLEISFDGDTTNLYCGTVGSGATINLRVNPLTMSNLFTTDPQKFMVKIYSNSILIWQGFISTGISYEELNTNKGVLFTLKANDGMAVLDMIPYRPDPSTYYESNTAAAIVLQRIMSKLNLTFDNGWGAMDYRVDDYEQSIFFNLGVNQSNYIDENGKVMTCREVLDTIMNSLGLRMSFRGSAFHVIDPINLHDVTKGQILSSNWDANLQNYPGGYLDISLNQIKWYSTGITKDQTQPYNQIEIKYDPYSLTDLSYDLADLSNWSNAGSFTGPLGPLGPNQYYINNTIQYKNIITDGSILQQAIKRNDGSEVEYYLKLQKNTHNQTGNAGIARISFPFSNIYNDPNVFLRISADFRCNTLGYDNIYDSSSAATDYTKMNYIDVSIGYLLGGGPDSSIHWFGAKILSDYTLNAADFSSSQIQDQWITNTWKYPFGNLGSISKDGSINVYIGGYYSTGWLTTTDKNCLVKNINVDIVNANGESIQNTGQKYTALKSVSDNYINTPTEVNLKAGIGPYGTSRAAYRNPATLAPLDGIYRGLPNGSGTKYNTAFHVAQSFVSEYNNPRLILRGNLDVRTHLLDTQNYLIKWSTYFPNKAFFIANATYNDKYEYMSVEMIECTSTRDNITLT
jgi:hypothetical protein